MNPTRVPLCPPHVSSKDPWITSCTVCGVRLLDGISIEQLVGRVEALTMEPVQPTGRIRGTWTEILEEGDGQLWASWVRPARNFAGYEHIDTTNPDPTGEELSTLLLAELAGFPQVSASQAESASPEIGTAWSRRKPTRWDRFKRWTRATAEREFVSIATPLCLFWCAALWVVLGNDGIAGLWSALF
ncbi:hypothetical protein [Streptomyces neyagawaensis]|uniref:hypothetical protein n=1 Tax=Streptomyces neyagawaensis TaxID=42238 RepID=UPI0006E3A548|nr:hypothetical protein [Streptomyces neyagawaensis]MCL6738010.1 hypothetical protein [Streptomyces neyagawaensis]MDE1688315.1 hypothetical protein [Streptomyces neyagawaensis]